jgi:hypothetical protein
MNFKQISLLKLFLSFTLSMLLFFFIIGLSAHSGGLSSVGILWTLLFVTGLFILTYVGWPFEKRNRK